MLKMFPCVLLVVMVTTSLSDGFFFNQYARINDFYAMTHNKRHETIIAIKRNRNVNRQVHRMSQREKSEIVRLHNEVRALEGASNMELMSWHEHLASAAERWAEGCNYWHGQPPNSAIRQGMSQNLYATQSRKINLVHAIKTVWYRNEKRHYSYYRNRCRRGKQCGHYKTMVWDISRHVGCAYRRCDVLQDKGRNYTNAIILVCNYNPAGNIAGEKPHQKGPACSQCDNGASWCKDKLCNSNCSSSGDDCLCAARCYNCASFNSTTCQCSCTDGWGGGDCSGRCKDHNRHCGHGWRPWSCESSLVVQHYCHAMCGLCTKDPDAEADLCPPYGPGFYITDNNCGQSSEEQDDDSDSDDK